MIGRTKQHGLRSLWRTEFEVLDDSGTRFLIRLKNPIIQLLEFLINLMPVIGMVLNFLSGYFLNPTYIVSTVGGDEVAVMKKMPALWQGRYEIRALQKVSTRDGELIALSLLTLILMQKNSDG